MRAKPPTLGVGALWSDLAFGMSLMPANSCERSMNRVSKSVTNPARMGAQELSRGYWLIIIILILTKNAVEGFREFNDAYRKSKKGRLVLRDHPAKPLLEVKWRDPIQVSTHFTGVNLQRAKQAIGRPRPP